MDDLTKKHVLGKVKAYSATIEWQKRGLTHAHILLIMEDQSKPRTSEDIDKVVCCEFPNKETNPKLHSIIVANNIHGPCGDLNPKSQCMDKGKCTKQYPKQLRAATATANNYYPEYRRRAPQNDGHTHTQHEKERRGK